LRFGLSGELKQLIGGEAKFHFLFLNAIITFSTGRTVLLGLGVALDGGSDTNAAAAAAEIVGVAVFMEGRGLP
jgi:hypothetical protein